MSRSPSKPSRKKFAQPAANGNGMISSGSRNFAAMIPKIAPMAIGLVPCGTTVLEHPGGGRRRCAASYGRDVCRSPSAIAAHELGAEERQALAHGRWLQDLEVVGP